MGLCYLVHAELSCVSVTLNRDKSMSLGCRAFQSHVRFVCRWPVVRFCHTCVSITRAFRVSLGCLVFQSHVHYAGLSCVSV